MPGKGGRNTWFRTIFAPFLQSPSAFWPGAGSANRARPTKRRNKGVYPLRIKKVPFWNALPRALAIAPSSAIVLVTAAEVLAKAEVLLTTAGLPLFPLPETGHTPDNPRPPPRTKRAGSGRTAERKRPNGVRFAPFRPLARDHALACPLAALLFSFSHLCCSLTRPNPIRGCWTKTFVQHPQINKEFTVTSRHLCLAGQARRICRQRASRTTIVTA